MDASRRCALVRRARSAGEERRSYFRSDRVFTVDDGWYFTTRDEERFGPFTTAEEARDKLADFIAEMQT